MNRHSFGEAPGACPHSTPGTQGPDRIARNHYDAENRLIRVEKALGTPILQDYAKYEYWPNGTRRAVIDANGNRAEMSYDGFDRLRRWTFPSNAAGNANPADYEEYDYDLVGNRTKLRKRDGSELGYQYDNLDRVIRKVVPERLGLDPVHTRDVFYAYDHALGLQTHARFDSLDGEGVSTWYDAFGQPTTVLLNMGGVGRYVSYYHDDAGNLRSLGHPDGAAFVSDHDSLGRVTATFEHRSPASMDDYLIRYWYNPAGNRSGLVRGAGAGGFTTVWYRDPLERPTTIANDLPGTANDAPIELAYNEAGQIVSRTVHNPAYAAPTPANTARGYQVNGLNQYTGTTWGGAPNWSFEYDPNGNLTRSVDPVGTGTTGFLYDVENRLVSASGAASATLVYDPLGRLFQVTGGNGAVTRFLYDGDKLIAEYDGSGTLRKRYVHGPGADEPVAVYDGPALGLANRRYTMPDERGSIAALVNADGTPSWINRYDSWGVPGDNRGRFQYTGQAWIPELGLYYYKARFYSPWLGRFMQVDPIGYEDQMNLYAYVGNDPINGVDPSGECALVNGPNDTKIEAGICGTTAEAQAFVDGRIQDSTSAFGATEEAALARGGKISVAFGSEITDPMTGNSRPVDGGESQALEYSSGRREVIVVLDPSDEMTLSGSPIVFGKESERVASMEEIAEHEIAGHARDHIERRGPSEQRALNADNAFRRNNDISFRRTRHNDIVRIRRRIP